MKPPLVTISDADLAAVYGHDCAHPEKCPACQQRKALQSAESRGRLAILRRVAQLPSPVRERHPNDTAEPSVFVCDWCKGEWPWGILAGIFGFVHPDNGCLFPEAQSALRADTTGTGEENAVKP